MEPIRDLSWMRELQAAARRERLDLRGFRVSIIALTPTAARHQERYRFRLLAFDPVLGRPVLSVDLENDILGEYCLSVQEGESHQVLGRYDQAPSYESFRERALNEAATRLPLLGSRMAEDRQEEARF